MILKGFKEKSIKKYLNKMLSERKVYVDDSKVESLGIILNIDEVDDFELFRSLATYLHVRPNKLKVIAYSPSKSEKPNFWEICFNSKDIGWNGTIKNIELQTFLDTTFDVLISYYTSDEIELKLLTALSKATFKIGILQKDPRLNDLIIKTNLEEFKVFKKEIFKYLTILNKVSDE
ncbi:DUF6913 domain-containing protein [Aestuariivivens sediminis]|uniref:DUF6913 domain-containing protein n=1 Tax=Aestuariivivens sediminis TaxID=2913557 RepID=UPI001F57CCE1|nr:hypothetical protein [Aestuariivivens sediminis]